MEVLMALMMPKTSKVSMVVLAVAEVIGMSQEVVMMSEDLVAEWTQQVHIDRLVM